MAPASSASRRRFLTGTAAAGGAVMLAAAPNDWRAQTGVPTTGSAVAVPERAAADGFPLPTRGNGRAAATAAGSTEARSLPGRLPDAFDVRQWGVTGGGINDESATLQAVIDAAATAASDEGAQKIVDLAGLNIGLGSTLELSGKEHITLQNGKLTAVGTSWTGGQAMVRATHAASDFDNLSIRDLDIECSHRVSGIDLKHARNALIDNVHIVHMARYGIRTRSKCGQLMMRNLRIQQYYWGESGYNITANRSAYGIDLQTADWMLSDSVVNYCYCPLRGKNFYNGQVVNCHFYNGYTPDDGMINVIIDAAYNVWFVGCYFDNGIVHLRSPMVTVMSSHFTITDSSRNTRFIDLEAVEPSQTCSGLIIVGNRVSGRMPGKTWINLVERDGHSWGAVESTRICENVHSSHSEGSGYGGVRLPATHGSAIVDFEPGDLGADNEITVDLTQKMVFGDRGNPTYIITVEDAGASPSPFYWTFKRRWGSYGRPTVYLSRPVSGKIHIGWSESSK